MIAEEPVIPYDGRRVMCDGTHGGVAKEQVPKVYSHFEWQFSSQPYENRKFISR